MRTISGTAYTQRFRIRDAPPCLDSAPMPPITHTQPPLPPALPSALPACRRVTVTSPLTPLRHTNGRRYDAHTSTCQGARHRILNPAQAPLPNRDPARLYIPRACRGKSWHRTTGSLHTSSLPSRGCSATPSKSSTTTSLHPPFPTSFPTVGTSSGCPSGFPAPPASLRRLPAPSGFSAAPLLRFPCDGIPAPQPPCAPRAAAAAAASPAHLTVAVGVLPGAVPSWQPCEPRTYAWLHRRPTPPVAYLTAHPQSRPTFPCYHDTATEHDHGPTHASSRIFCCPAVLLGLCSLKST